MAKELSKEEVLFEVVGRLTTPDMFGAKRALPDVELLYVCKALLEEYEFTVIEPLANPFNIKKTSDLRNLFQGWARKKYSGEFPSLGRGDTFDNLVLKRFVESRQVGGASKRTALIECAEIIDTVFRHADKFNFNTPIGLYMFEPGTFSWVVDIALKIIHGEIDTNKERYVDAVYEEICNNAGIDWFKPLEEEAVNGS